MKTPSSLLGVPTDQQSGRSFAKRRLVAGVGLKRVPDNEVGLSDESRQRVQERVREIEEARREAEQRSHDVVIDR